jgi:hypothetical protein
MAMRSLSLIALFALAIGLTGCVNNSGTFHSPDGKSVAMCNSSGFGLIPAIAAQNDYNNCRNGYIAAGYQEGPAPILSAPVR